MGLAIIWIFLYHSKIFFPTSFLFHPFRLIVSSGYGGVDIFFFLSGFGLMHHMLVYQSNAGTFYKKRLLSIFPSYVIATIVVLSIEYSFGSTVSINKIFLSLTTIGFWSEGSTFYWFIPSIVFLYSIYPIFYKYYIASGVKTLYRITFFSIALCFIFTVTNNQHLIMLFSRIPIFFIGSHIKYISIREREISKLEFHAYLVLFLLFSIILTGVIYLSSSFSTKSYGIAYYPFTIGVVPLCLFTGILLNFLFPISKKNKLLSACFFLLVTCGANSLEIYLIHKQIVFQLADLIKKNISAPQQHLAFISYGNYVEYIIYFLITLVLSLQLHKLSSYIRTQLNRSFNTTI